MPRYRHKYNIILPYIVRDAFTIEQFGFEYNQTEEKGGLGRYGHFRKICDFMSPHVGWNPWAEKFIKTLCDDSYALKMDNLIHRYVTMMGCAAAAKTFNAALYAYHWWGIAPGNSICLLTTTSAKMARRRIWGPLVDLYNKSPRKPGHLVDSKSIIQSVQGNDKYSISVIAVEKGETAKAVSKIQGQHAPRILVVIDEATDTPVAIVKACENLKKSCQDFTLLMIGNPKGYMDPLGKAGEPKLGWSSVSVEDEEWKTNEGICIHFDGHKSPNVLAGETIYPYIYTYEDYLINKGKRGSDTLESWQFDRGFPAPDGVVNTVMTYQMVEKYGGRGTFQWYQRATPVAALDPAFGGDRCVLKFGLLGDFVQKSSFGESPSSKLGLQITETVEIHPKAKSEHEMEYQIAWQVMEECKKRGVHPKNFGADATGTGRGVFAVLAHEWSSEIVRVEFGGSPSERPASEEDPRQSKDVYDRRVTELWFFCREVLKSGQLKGLSSDDVLEFSFRQYEHEDKKIKLETKADCKLRLEQSPDHADAVAVLCEVARQHGLNAGGQIKTRSKEDALAKARDFGSLYEDDQDDTEQKEPELFEAFEGL